MSRRRKLSLIRDVGVDPRYNSGLLQKFINVLMQRGKKSVSRRVVYGALSFLKKKSGSAGEDFSELEVFKKALENVKPSVEVKSRRVGGSVYQVPTEVDLRRAQALAMRWVISAASSRRDANMGLRLGKELSEAADGKGNAVKKKVDVHKMAEANRAFSHFSW